VFLATDGHRLNTDKAGKALGLGRWALRFIFILIVVLVLALVLTTKPPRHKEKIMGWLPRWFYSRKLAQFASIPLLCDFCAFA
jgi:hypothetical protein